MKKACFGTALILWAALGAPHNATAEPAWRRGILLETLKGDGGDFGQPGEVVTYRPTTLAPDPNGEDQGVEIEVGGKKQTFRGSSHVLPFDASFSPAWVLRAVENEPYDTYIEPTENPKVLREAKTKLALITSILRNFPTNTFAEQLWFARFAQTARVEGLETWGKDISRTRQAIVDYLRRYPNGQFKDEVEWKQAQLWIEPDEYVGNVDMLMESVAAYGVFLRSHPQSSFSDAARLRIAELYRMAFESLLEEHRPQPAKADDARMADTYRKMAEGAYEQLVTSKRVETAIAARIALFSLRAGRHIYVGIEEGDY